MTDSDILAGDLSAWTWDASKDDFTREGPEIPKEIADEIPELARAGGMSRDQFDRLVGGEKFAGALAKLTRWVARTRGVQSIALDETDPAYAEAAEVVYRRVMDGPGRHLLPYVSNDDLIDIWIVSAFAVPYFHGIAAEIQAKRKAATAKPVDAKQQAESSEDRKDDDNGK